MSQTVFDERAAAQLERLYRSRDVRRRRQLVREALEVRRGHRVLDVGCGPGFLTADLLADVGPEGDVVGIDSSPVMLAAATQRCREHANASFQPGSATALPVPDGAFDRVLCVQVLEFVPDTAAALGELHRVLRPGGRAVVWDVDWATLSWHSGDPARMARMLEAWDRHVAHPALPQVLATAFRRAGFSDVRADAHAFATTAPDPETYGGNALTMVHNYLAGLADLDPREVQAWADEQRELGERGEYYFSVTQVCFSAVRRA